MDHNDIFLCSLSGVEAPEEAILPDDLADELGLLPVGWTRLMIERRLPNPDWQEIQQVKHMMAEAAAQQLPEDQRVPAALRAIRVQVAAQYAALEEQMSPFVNMKEVLFVAPPEMDPALAAEFFEIRDRLGLPVPSVEDEEDESEGEADEESVEAPEPLPVASEA
jgi:anion-transporting  ArsA/GET3 family ATPase